MPGGGVELPEIPTSTNNEGQVLSNVGDTIIESLPPIFEEPEDEVETPTIEEPSSEFADAYDYSYDLVTLQDFVAQGQHINFNPANCANPNLAVIYNEYQVFDVTLNPNGEPQVGGQVITGDRAKAYDLLLQQQIACSQAEDVVLGQGGRARPRPRPVFSMNSDEFDVDNI